VRTHRFHSPRIVTSLLTALLLSGPVACSKPQPSEDYFQAHTRFSKLYAEQGDEAFADPAMDEVEAMLARVPADSLDAKAAQELRQRIQSGRTQFQSQEKARQEAIAQARTPTSMPGGFASEGSASRSAAPPPPVEETSDAGTGSSGPAVGTSASELASGFSGCFQKGEQVEVRNRGVRDRWELADRATCRQQYAALADQVLLIEEGKVLALVPKSSLQSIPEDGGSK